MKKLCLTIGLCLLLTGCASVDTFETLGQIDHESNTQPAMAKIALTVPESAAAEALGGAEGTMYACDGYLLIVQTRDGGDMDTTAKALSGFSVQNLSVIESGTSTCKRYEWVWSAVDDEDGERLCRAMVLDDGNYHYCLSAIAPAAQAGALQEQWTQVFRSFRLDIE